MKFLTAMYLIFFGFSALGDQCDKTNYKEFIYHRDRIDALLNERKKCELDGINLKNGNLWNTDFRNANLRNADFRDADCRLVDFTWADLRGADFRDADIRNATFRWSNLDGAKYNYATDLPGIDLFFDTEKYGMIYVD